MTAIGKVSLEGFFYEDEIFTYLVKTGAGEATSDSIGWAAMTQDTTADNQVRLAGEGDRILGVLQSYEARTVEGITVGAVSQGGGYRFQVTTNASDSPNEKPARGDFLIGAALADGTKGYVRKATSSEIQAGKAGKFQVFQVDPNNLFVIAISV